MGMGKRWIKRVGVGIAGLVVVAGAALVIAAQLGERKMQRRIDVQVSAAAARTDPASIERGAISTCRAAAWTVTAPMAAAGWSSTTATGCGQGTDISPGPGGVVKDYSDLDWTRAIRHGIKPDGRPVMIMPSEDYNRLTDKDLGGLIGYVRQMPPAQGGPAVVQLPMPLKALYAIGVIPDAASKIDHRLPPAQPVPEGVTVEHGTYVANACIGCHGPRLEGGRIPGSPPDWPPAANLRPTADGPMHAYADAKAFGEMFKTGKRPDGSEIKVMPFLSLREMKDTDVQALFLYLRSLR